MYECLSSVKIEMAFFRCLVCSEIFKTVSDRDDHLYTHVQEHKEKVILFKCSVCKLVFQNKTEADKHMQIHINPAHVNQLPGGPHLLVMPANSMKHTAAGSSSSSSSSTKQNFVPQASSKIENSHIYSQFAAVKPPVPVLPKALTGYECAVCGKKFSSLLNRNQHLATHVGQPSVPALSAPALVLQSAVSPPALVLQNAMSPPAPVLQSAVSPPAPVLQSAVSPPVPVLRSAVSPPALEPPSARTTHECTLCGQTFGSVSDRNQHLGMHVGKPLYKCPTCRRLFSNRALYLDHVKTHNKPIQIVSQPTLVTRFATKPATTPTSIIKLATPAVSLIKHAPPATSVAKPASITMSVIKPATSAKSIIKSATISVTKPTTTAMNKFTCQVCGLDCKTLSDWMSHMSSHTWEQSESVPKLHAGEKDDDHSSTDTASESETDLVKGGTAQQTIGSEIWMDTETIYKNIVNSTVELDPNINIKTEPELHVCVLCGQEFEAWEELDTHLQVHGVQKKEPDDNKDLVFNTDTIQRFAVYDKVIMSRTTVDKSRHKCTCCSKGFLCPSDLRKHMMTHTGERPYTCCVCGTSFTHVHMFNIHFAKHAKENPLACMLCSQVCENFEVLTDHILSHTSKDAALQCAYCGKDFTKQGILRQHVATHAGAKVYKCARCGMDFPTKVELMSHVLIHTGGKLLQCSICNKRFTWPATLYRHIRHRNCKQFRDSSAVKPDMDAYEDEVKKEVTELIGSKKQPIVTDKKEEKMELQYKCFHCAEEFNQRSEFKEHMKSHKTPKKSHTCPHCQRTYRTRHKLKKHVAGHTCKCCCKVFSRMVDLRKHLLNAKEVKPVCFICKKSFNHSSILKRHLKTHTDMNAPQTCFRCGLQFRCQDSFTDHKCHPRLSVFKYTHCDACVRGFVTVEKLETHLKAHLTATGRRRRII